MAAEPDAIVLDTNVVSELMRPAPNDLVRRWALQTPPDLIRTTAVTLAEIRSGIARLPPGRRRDVLSSAADDVFETFAGRVLPFDAAAAGRYGDLVVRRERTGSPISGFDAQIAAICLHHRATLATRNTADFAELGLDLVDPWLRDDRDRPVV